MKKKLLPIFALMALASIAAGCAVHARAGAVEPVKNYEDVGQRMTEYLNEQMLFSDTVGLSIALVDDQRIVWASGFGYSDMEAGTEASESTVYRVGSISKLFTATAAMQLREKGLIYLDRPVAEYVPGFSIRTRFPDAGPITPRNIMTHHSGIPSDILKGEITKNPDSLQDFIPKLAEEYVSYPPGLIFCYSNVGVTVLGRMIELVGGAEFADYMEENVFSKMGMTSSSFRLTPDIEKNLSQGYLKGKAGEQMPMRDVPAANLYSTVTDMSRFIMTIFADGMSGENRILEPKTIKEMLTRQNGNIPLDLDFRIGLAWILIDIPGTGPEPVQGAMHDGSTVYFKTSLVIIPDKKLGAVVLTNSSEGGLLATRACLKALNLMMEAKAGDVAEENEDGAEQKEDEAPVIGPAKSPPEGMKNLEGFYESLAGLIEIEDKKDKLIGKLMGLKFRFEPLEDGSFSFSYMMLGFIPIKSHTIGKLIPFLSPENLRLSFEEIEGRNVIIIKSGDSSLLFASKLNDAPVPEQWLKRIGDYTLQNRGEDSVCVSKISIKKIKDFLYVSGELVGIDGGRSMAFIIEPVSENEAVIAGLGRYRGDTISAVESDGGELIRYSGYLFERKGKHE